MRVSYLQPAEIRPGLLRAMADTPGVVPYYDISFQHASEPLLRSMRRFGSREAFLDLLARVRADAPEAGIRCNVIVGFPGETEADLDELEAFLTEARLDVVGVFGYSDEDGTEAEGYAGKLAPEVVAERLDRFTRLVEELNAQRAEERIGERVVVLVEEIDDEDGLRHRAGRLPGPRRRRRHHRARPRGRPGAPGRRPRAGRRRRHRGDRPRRGAAMTPQTFHRGEGPAPRPTDWNLPNALTVLRFLLVPVYAVLLFQDGGDEPWWRFWAWVVFALAAVTDGIDGKIARRRGEITNFGKVADPIADKALTGTAFIGLSLLGVVWWWVTVVILVREIGITVLRFVVIRHGVMPAGRGGKLKTMLQTLSLGALTLPALGAARSATPGCSAAYVVLGAALVMTVAQRHRLRLQGRAAARDERAHADAAGGARRRPGREVSDAGQLVRRRRRPERTAKRD